MKHRDAYIAIGMIVAAIVGYMILITQFEDERLKTRGAIIRVDADEVPYLIRMSGKQFGDADLKLPMRTPTVERLYFNESLVTDEGIDFLVHLPKLKEIDLSNSKITDEALRKLSKLKTLEILRCSGTSITDQGLSYFVEHPSLYALIIEDCPGVTIKGLRPFHQHSLLRRFDLKRISLDYSGYCEVLDMFPNALIEFDGNAILGLAESTIFNGNVGPVQYTLITDNRDVSLTLTANPKHDVEGEQALKWFEDFRHKEKIASFIFSFDIDDPELVIEMLQKMPNIRKLSVKGTVTQDLFNEIARHTKLERLGIYSSYGDVATVPKNVNSMLSFKPLSQLKSLKILELRQPHVERSSISSLGTLKNLQRLSIEQSQLRDEDVAFIVHLPKLEYLDLQGNGITNKTLDRISNIRTIRNLYLKETRVEEDSLKVFQKDLREKRQKEIDAGELQLQIELGLEK